MIYLVCERKKVIMLSLGFLIILIAGSWFFLNKALPAQEVKAPLLEIELEAQQQSQQQSPKKSDSEKVKKQEFFVDCRLTRDRIRSQQIDVLKEIAGNPASSVETRDHAQQQLMKITERTGREVELEKLVVAQGFKDAVVLIQDQSATVIIQGTSLSGSEEEKIKDVVGRVALLEPGSIYVIPKP
ncbi:MAG: SpoIIIAH-like family protein [Syntrophaceticus schinkii]|jgi:stage III sporulation protein AH|nr:SpoIIIAH-like family protein [Syntrophaceticus schinkii]